MSPNSYLQEKDDRVIALHITSNTIYVLCLLIQIEKAIKFNVGFASGLKRQIDSIIQVKYNRIKNLFLRN
jgi:hypothetical protein